jgi:ClpP class serine protease
VIRFSQQVQCGKPFVVSMGNIAVSGSYYIPGATDTIFTDESNIIASIDVMCGKPITKGM